MIGSMLSTILKFIANMFGSFFNFIGEALNRLFAFLGDFANFIAQLLTKLFNMLISVLLAFFQVIYDVIRCVLYLIYMIGVLAVKLFLVLFELGKLLVSFVVGLFRTAGSLFYTSRGSGGHGYSSTIGKIFSKLDALQLDVVAYILLFLIWLFIGLTTVKILSSMKNS